MIPDEVYMLDIARCWCHSGDKIQIRYDKLPKKKKRHGCLTFPTLEYLARSQQHSHFFYKLIW